MRLSVIIPTSGRGPLRQVLKRLPQDMCQVLVGCDRWFPSKTLQSNFPHVQWIKSPKPGASAARNICINHATHQIIAFIGDDTIPGKTWVTQVIEWHKQHQNQEKAMLGHTPWTDDLMQDAFHRWLIESNILFDFGGLMRGKKPGWRHFYTCNISLKRSFLEDMRFDETFTGWGFEDIELGYRLHKKGLHLHFAPNVICRHDHPQTLSEIIAKATQARTNAQYFEHLHPTIRILPPWWKCAAFRLLSQLFRILPQSKQTRWWMAWKGAWIGLGKGQKNSTLGPK